MPIPTWLPAITSLLLGFVSIAIAVLLFSSARRAPSVALASSARIAAAIFLLGSAVAYFGETAALSPPFVELLGVLRALTAVTGVVAAVLFVAASKPAAPNSARPSSPKPIPSATNTSEPAHDATRSTPPPPTSSTKLLDEPSEPGFLGLVSHELRTPLTAMQLLVDRLNDDGAELAPRHRKIVDRMATAATRLTDLVDSILYYARIQNGRLVTSVEPFDLAIVATEAAEELRPQAARKSLELRAVRREERVAVESDPKLVRLVIVNLVSNAVKFTDRGAIAVSASAEGNRRVVRVEDTGRGIPPDEQARIFEPFQQCEPTKHKHQPGIGLGLSLARRIVESLGGRITVRSEIGKGSIFELSLPAVAVAPRA